MLPTSAYRLRLRTDSADNNALILLAEGELVAILVELEDEAHGDDRGRWVVEKLFGLERRNPPGSFDTAGAAADWVSGQVDAPPFLIGDDLDTVR